jgi:hypothetical protein
MRSAVIILTCALLFGQGVCNAQDHPVPQNYKAATPDGHYGLEVNVETGRHTLYDLQSGAKPLWSFQRPVTDEQFFLSTDGRVVAVLAPQEVSVQDLRQAPCIQFWNETGVFRSYAFSEICPAPLERTIAGIDTFRRQWYLDAWRPGPDNWDAFCLETTDLYEFTFSLKDGTLLDKQIVPATLLFKRWFVEAMMILACAVPAAGFLLVWWLRRLRPNPPPMTRR